MKPSALKNPYWLYLFLGIHSFLIGLFPFYIAVYLWNQGFSIAQISGFISIGALGYLCTLWCWDRLHKKLTFQQLINLSFLAQTLMLSSFFWTDHPWFLVISAFSYGVSNCFFWVTQRALFLEHIDPMSSGRKFGNLQIFVFFIIQFSILSGGYLLESQGFQVIFYSSICISLIGISAFYLGKKTPQLPKSLTSSAPLSLSDITSFRDQHGSKSNFLLDGIFLFLEGFYWTISLFLMSRESFFNLGILVIILAFGFAISFYLIKNTIDQLPQNTIYTSAVILYSLSWILRAFAPQITNIYWLGIIILIITFFTSFFRLSYNKRFFDLAHNTKKHSYLFLKSYYSQFGIFLIFGLFSLLQAQELITENMSMIYLFTAPLSLLYLNYHITHPSS